MNNIRYTKYILAIMAACLQSSGSAPIAHCCTRVSTTCRSIYECICLTRGQRDERRIIREINERDRVFQEKQDRLMSWIQSCQHEISLIPAQLDNISIDTSLPQEMAEAKRQHQQLMLRERMHYCQNNIHNMQQTLQRNNDFYQTHRQHLMNQIDLSRQVIEAQN